MVLFENNDAMTLSITTFSKMTFGITTFNVPTYSNDIQHINIQHKDIQYSNQLNATFSIMAKDCYAECGK